MPFSPTPPPRSPPPKNTLNRRRITSGISRVVRKLSMENQNPQPSCDVNAEKAIALRHYRFRRNSIAVVKACAVVAPVWFVLHCSSTAWITAAAAYIPGGEFNAVFDNRLYVLSCIVALIGAICLLPGQNGGDVDDDNSPAAAATRSPDLYDEFALNSMYAAAKNQKTETIAVGGGENWETEAGAGTNAVVAAVGIVETETVTVTESRCDAPVGAITGNNRTEVAEEASVQEMRYRRTRSEVQFEEKKMVVAKLKSSKSVVQRSETEVGRNPTEETAADREELNDEELLRRVNEFIVKNKRQQSAEIADKEERRKLQEEAVWFRSCQSVQFL